MSCPAKAFECLVFFVQQSVANYRPPTVDEMAERFDVQKNAIQGYLRSLEKHGYMESRGKNRGMQVTAKTREEFKMGGTAERVVLTGKNGSARLYFIEDGIFAVITDESQHFVPAPSMDSLKRLIQRKLDK